MSNAFTNFLGGVVNGLFGPGPNLKSYEHADRLYVRNTYARAPKVGFLYFVEFNINDRAISDAQWIENKSKRDVGLLVKKIDLPKFTVAHDTLNQYNRKTVVQTKLTYNPISIEFHDDNGDLTNKLWKNYYSYYYADSFGNNTKRFSDTKYGTVDNPYGLDSNQNEPFFKSIDVYVLHQQKFTKYTLVNPLITEWSHDNLDQNDGGKILQNKMTLSYESVIYDYGKISKETSSNNFTAIYYDKEPSPLSVSGNGTNTLFGVGGVIAGADSVLNNLASGNFLTAAIQARTVARNVGQLNKDLLTTEVSNIFNSTSNEIRATGGQQGIGASIQNGVNQTGIFLFNNKNAGTTKSTPSNATGKSK